MSDKNSIKRVRISQKGLYCSIDGCSKAASSKGFCANHYNLDRTRLLALGLAVTRPKRPLAERFWSYVDKAGPNDCWLWTGATQKGYGAFGVDGKRCGAHRVSFSLHNTEDISDLVVRHRCHTPLCVNPAHLMSGTHLDNVHDCIAAGRRRAGASRRFSSARIAEIRTASGTNKEVADRFGLSPSWVGDIRHGAMATQSESLPPSLRSVQFRAIEAKTPNSCAGCLLEKSTLRECKNSVRIARERGTLNCDDLTESGNTHIFVGVAPEVKISPKQGEVAPSVEQGATSITKTKRGIHE